VRLAEHPPRWNLLRRLRTVVVDDEPLARTNISVMLKQDPEIEIVRECGPA